MGARPSVALPLTACKRRNCPVCRFNRPVLNRVLAEFLGNVFEATEIHLFDLTVANAMLEVPGAEGVNPPPLLPTSNPSALVVPPLV